MAENLSVLELFLVRVEALWKVGWFDFVPRFHKHKLNENWIMNNILFAKDVLVRKVWSWKVGQCCSLDSFFRLTKCLVQCKSSCSITPKYLIWDDGWSFFPFMRKLRFLLTFFCLDLNIISSVLLVFMDNLLALIHSKTSFSSLFMYLLILLSGFAMRCMLVSSAKWCTVLSTTFL